MRTALDEQRRAIARDVHDGLAQELAFIAGQLDRIEHGGDAPDADLVRELRAASRRALQEARLTIDVLRSGDDAPLAQLVERAVASFGMRFGVAVELRLELADGEAPAPERCGALLRILGQALVNAIDHGTAQRVGVDLRSGRTGTCLRVADDGRGFPAGAGGAGGGGRERGWGLISMRERAELLGGSLTISTQPGAGTEVTVVLP